ncbi:MAG: right-handed parallel beta-helix repeat-containing protein [Planctomycetota bacterium]|nr:right-handed parallel beta-helix repeat-containing protein [Planctomycetota bacterium]
MMSVTRRLIAALAVVVALVAATKPAFADTYYIYGDTAVGSPFNWGTNDSPLLSLAEYQAIFDSQEFVDDEVILAGEFRESLFLDFLYKQPGSKVHIRQWLPTDPPPPLAGRPIKRAMIRADKTLVGEFTFDNASGYYKAGPLPVAVDEMVGRLLYKWDDPQQLDPNGLNTGHIKRKSMFAGRPPAGSLGLYEFHYDPASKYVYLNVLGMSANKYDYSWVPGFNSTSRSFTGLGIQYGNGCTIEGIEGALWCDDNYNGHTFAAFESKNCVLRNLRVRDAGHHAVAVSNTNDDTPIESCVIEGCEVFGLGGGDFGNAPLMMVAGGIKSNVKSGTFRNNIVHLYNPLDPTGAPESKRPLVPIFMGALNPQQATTTNMSVQGLTAIWYPGLSGPDTTPWVVSNNPYKANDDETPSQYEVRFDRCRWENMNRSQIGSDDFQPRGNHYVSVQRSWFGYTRTGPDRNADAEPYYAIRMSAPSQPVVGQTRVLFSDCHFDVAFDQPPGYRRMAFILASSAPGAAGARAIFNHCNFAFRPLIPRADQEFRFAEWGGRSKDMLVRVKNSILAWNAPLFDDEGVQVGSRRLFHNDFNGSRSTRDFVANGYYNWNWNDVSQGSPINNGFNAAGVPNFLTTADGDPYGTALIDRPFLRPMFSPDLIPGSHAAKLNLGARPDNGATDFPLQDSILISRPGGAKGGSPIAPKKSSTGITGGTTK